MQIQEQSTLDARISNLQLRKDEEKRTLLQAITQSKPKSDQSKCMFFRVFYSHFCNFCNFLVENHATSLITDILKTNRDVHLAERRAEEEERKK